MKLSFSQEKDGVKVTTLIDGPDAYPELWRTVKECKEGVDAFVDQLVDKCAAQEEATA